jgi:hypothetical protein
LKPRSKASYSSTDNRFYQRPPRIELRHDRFGNRSSYLGDYDVKDVKRKLSETKKNFYSSQRLDLGKPDNFFPGPGSYYSNTNQFRNTFSDRSAFTPPKSSALK